MESKNYKDIGQYRYYLKDEKNSGQSFIGFDKTQENQKVLINKRDITNLTEENRSELSKNILVLLSIHHPNIYTPLCVRLSSRNLYVISDFQDYETLSEIINSLQKEDEQLIISLMRDMINAVFELHKLKLVHRNLSPDSFWIINKKAVLKDFEFTRMVEFEYQNLNVIRYSSVVINSPYVAPEITSLQVFSYASDVWSLGIIFYEMITSKKISPKLEEKEELEKSLEKIENNKTFNGMNIVLKKMLCHFKDRINLEKLLNNSFFEEKNRLEEKNKQQLWFENLSSSNKKKWKENEENYRNDLIKIIKIFNDLSIEIMKNYQEIGMDNKTTFYFIIMLKKIELIIYKHFLSIFEGKEIDDNDIKFNDLELMRDYKKIIILFKKKNNLKHLILDEINDILSNKYCFDEYLLKCYKKVWNEYSENVIKKNQNNNLNIKNNEEYKIISFLYFLNSNFEELFMNSNHIKTEKIILMSEKDLINELKKNFNI